MVFLPSYSYTFMSVCMYVWLVMCAGVCIIRLPICRSFKNLPTGRYLFKYFLSIHTIFPSKHRHSYFYVCIRRKIIQARFRRFLNEKKIPSHEYIFCFTDRSDVALLVMTLGLDLKNGIYVYT